jgi:hypothetical protein
MCCGMHLVSTESRSCRTFPSLGLKEHVTGKMLQSGNLVSIGDAGAVVA